MGDKDSVGERLHRQSDFVVCRACSRFFYFCEIYEHQAKEHPNHEWDQKDDPFRRFYYLTNREVAWTLNRGRDLRNGIHAIRDLMVF